MTAGSPDSPPRQQMLAINNAVCALNVTRISTMTAEAPFLEQRQDFEREVSFSFVTQENGGRLQK